MTSTANIVPINEFHDYETIIKESVAVRVVVEGRSHSTLLHISKEGALKFIGDAYYSGIAISMDRIDPDDTNRIGNAEPSKEYGYHYYATIIPDYF